MSEKLDARPRLSDSAEQMIIVHDRDRIVFRDRTGQHAVDQRVLSPSKNKKKNSD